MRTFTVPAGVNLEQLAAEIAAAQGWQTPPGLSLSVVGGVATLTIDRDAVQSTVTSVVGAHQPAAPPNPNATLRAALGTATTVAQIKAALLARFAN